MTPQEILNRSKHIRNKEFFRIWTERTYALIFCVCIGLFATKLLTSKPLESKAKIIASTPQCSLASFWLDAYNQKECSLSTDIKITPLEMNRKTKSVMGYQDNYKNLWDFNPYKKDTNILKVPAAAFRKAKIRWKYRKEIKEASKRTGLSKNLIAAVIVQESNGNPKAVSHCGAQGLMQLMPATGRLMGCRDPFNPRENILAGSKYLARQLKTFGSKELALAAYNAGPGNAHRYKRIKETREYVPGVLRHEYQLAMLGD